MSQIDAYRGVNAFRTMGRCRVLCWQLAWGVSVAGGVAACDWLPEMPKRLQESGSSPSVEGSRGAAEVVAPVAPSTPGAPLTYRLTLGERGNHYLSVRATIPTERRDTVELMMPTWTPGSYLIREYSGHLEGLEARAGDVGGRVVQPDALLPVVKLAKNRWTVTTQGADSVVLTYKLYAAQPTVRSNWVGPDHAVLVGAATFVTRVDALGRPHDVQIKMPKQWPHSVTGLAPHPSGAPHMYRADRFDTLVDSPLVLGRAKIAKFEVDGVPHRLANVGGGSVWNHAASAQAVEAIAREAVRFWGVIPYENYTFLNLIGEGRGGLEHLNSTLMMTSRWGSTHRETFLNWMGLVSHEFFHTWNVKRLRPAPLGPFDYESEVYTRSLWIAEGLTSYYDDLLLVRAGLMTRSEYFERLGKAITSLQSTPGRLVQSLEDASFDAWVKYYRTDANSRNSIISYYTKGAVVGFLLDAKIRQSSEGKRSLDSVMRAAYERFSGERGFTPEQFEGLAEEVAETDLSKFFAEAVRGVGELNYGPTLQWYGLQLGQAASPSADKGPEGGKFASEKTPPAAGSEPGGGVADAGVGVPLFVETKPPEDPKAGYLGVRSASRNGRLVVESVAKGSPAWLSTLSPGDELLAIDEYRLEDSLEQRLKHYAPGESVELLVARRGKLVTVSVELGQSPEDEERWKLAPVEAPSQAQRAAVDAWLGRASLRTLR